MLWHWYLLVVPGLVDKLGGSFLGIFALWGRTQAGFSLGPPCSTQYLPGSQPAAPGKAQEIVLSQSEPRFVPKNEAQPREVTMEEQCHCSPGVTTPCLPRLAARKPLPQSGRAFLVQQTLPWGLHLLLGRRDGWLILQWGRDKVSQALVLKKTEPSHQQGAISTCSHRSWGSLAVKPTFKGIFLPFFL